MSYIPARPKRTRPDFSLTIINIVFLMLLFYLATGSLIKQNELQADIPFTTDLPLERLPRPLLLVTADGRFFLDGNAIERKSMGEAARLVMRKSAYLNVLAEQSMSAGELISILAEVQAAGLPARLVTLHDRPDAKAAR
jgi:biopolymer transport protein ExbD